MAQSCPMPNCGYPNPPRLLGKRVAQQAADTDLLCRLLMRQIELTMAKNAAADDDWSYLKDGNLDKYFKSLDRQSDWTFTHDVWRTGKDYVEAMHASAHGSRSDRGSLPSLTALNKWREMATSMTSTLATSDAEWYAKFWSDVFVSGYNVPASVRRELRVPG